MKCPFHRILTCLGLVRSHREDPVERIANIVESLDAHALRMWREGHHTFFLLIQFGIIELGGFLKSLRNHDFEAANRHLDRSSVLMLGSGAAMRIAGDVNGRSYGNVVVPSMMKASPKFSGGDSSDHGEFIEIFKEIKRMPGSLPIEVKASFDRFMSSVSTALGAHEFVCAFHRGNERSSTGSGKATKLSGVETLHRLGASRLNLLSSKRGRRGKIERPMDSQ